MKRFLSNMVAAVLSIPTLALMFLLLMWSIAINIIAKPISEDFKPYRWLDKLNDLLYLMERKIFH